MRMKPLLRKRPTTLRRARGLRKPLTPQERTLGARLRARRAGFKFRRQHPIGRYTLDFFCREAGLAIEIDSGIHAEPANVDGDRQRTAWLRTHGIEVMRVAAADVERSPEEVVGAIVEVCRKRASREGDPGGPEPV